MSERFTFHASALEHTKPHEILLFLGGLLSVLLGGVFFGLGWVQGLPQSQLWSTTRVLWFVVDLVVGIFLWFAVAVARKSPLNAGIMAIVLSIILLAFGSTPGLIGGVVGLLGGCVAVVLPYLPAKG